MATNPEKTTVGINIFKVAFPESLWENGIFIAFMEIETIQLIITPHF